MKEPELRPVWELPLSPSGIVMMLRKGGRVRIRPVRKDDVAALEHAYLRLSEQSRYFRFFGARPELGDKLAAMLTDIDHKNHFAWAVFDPDRPSEVGDDSGFVVASARLIRDPDPTSAEAALAVVDEYHNRGIGRFLIELLVSTAVEHGVSVLRFEVLHENRPMRELISAMGAIAHPIEGDRSVIDYHLALPAADALNAPAGALYDLLRHLARPSTTDLD